MSAGARDLEAGSPAPVKGLAASDSAATTVADPPASFTSASWPSRATFWWLNGLLSLGFARPLQMADVPPLPIEEEADQSATAFEHILHALYDQHQPRATADAAEGAQPVAPRPPSSSPPSFAVAIYRLVGRAYLQALCYAFVSEVLAFAGPILVQLITDFLDSPEEPVWRGWLFVALLFVLPTIGSVCRNAYYVDSWRVAIRVRSALLTSVFRKSLQLSPAARRLVTDGEILTIMGADAQKLSDLWPVLFVLFTAPFSILACFVLLWLQVGASTLAGAGVIALLMPCNIWLGKKSGGYRREEAAYTDLRLKLVKEAMSSMKVIKQYGWSASFQARITEVRTKEIAIRKRAAYLEALSNSILILTPVLISLVTFLVFAGTGHELTATNVFASLALFNVMRFQLSQFPQVLTALFEARVSLQRLRRLLLREELQPNARDYAAVPLPPPGETIALIDNATFSWDLGEDSAAQPAPAAKDAPLVVVGDSNFRLADVSLRVTRGAFVAVVGAVGSGKSSLLQALLGEVKRVSGPRVFLRGRVALVPQTAWILNMSLQDNVLFGLPMHEEHYRRTIEVCCLAADLAQLPAGDQTQIGDRGVNLSGGQRQRCSIARAVYSVLMGASDVVLIDDPLSAVDAHVAKALFENVLAGLLKAHGITVMLAMNQLHFLPRTDHVVVMKAGRVVQQGEYAQLMQQPEGELATLMSSYGFKQDDEEHDDEEEEEASKEPTIEQLEGDVPSEKHADTGDTKVAPAEPAASPSAASSPKAGATSQAETRVEGSVGMHVYAAYIRACGGWPVFGSLVFLFCIHQTGRVYADFWLADWSDQDWDHPSRTLAMWMGIFSLFGGVVTLASLIRSMIFAEQGLAGAFRLHQSMLRSIFRSPAGFFDTTPIGRIVNRFSSDIDKLDHLLVRTLEGWGGCIFFVLGTFIAICVVYPYFVFPLLAIIAVYYRVQLYYVASSRELQRLDSISKSPIYSHFGESLTGASSIRAFDTGAKCFRQNEAHIDANHRPVLAYQAALCWLGIRIEFVSTLLMTISGIFAVSSRNSVDASLVGLTIVYSITITSFLNFAVRLGSVVESMMSSVERIDEYSALPEEAAPYLPDVDPPNDWPRRGAIKFEQCVLRYRPELDLVLRGISAEIRPGEKVGIIGRTGSGKSSLMVALFRLVELASGRITIDGVDISQIGLESLRSRITLIPQEPTIFSGSIRYNLDPFAASTDHQLWHSLQLVGLANKVRAMDGQLDFNLSEGESLSVGERQLLCVARALLRQTQVLVLDEATASVDVESDVRIQQVIASQFGHATVLAIAHRLSTIMDYDSILVMDAGQVAEFGTPHELLQRADSALLALVEATGPASAAHLKDIALQAFQRKRDSAAGAVVTPTHSRAGWPSHNDTTDASCVRFHTFEDEQHAASADLSPSVA